MFTLQIFIRVKLVRITTAEMNCLQSENHQNYDDHDDKPW